MRIACAAFFLLTACATTTTHKASRWSDSERLLIPEIKRLSGESAYDVVARTRPHFLRARTPLIQPMAMGEEMIGVYINGHFAGGPESLREISSDFVYSVRRMSASNAGIKYGRHFREGAIEVTLLSR